MAHPLYTKKKDIDFNYLVVPNWTHREIYYLIDLDNQSPPLHEGTELQCYQKLKEIQPKCRWLNNFVKKYEEYEKTCLH